jgi:hypothetical protein
VVKTDGVTTEATNSCLTQQSLLDTPTGAASVNVNSTVINDNDPTSSLQAELKCQRELISKLQQQLCFVKSMSAAAVSVDTDSSESVCSNLRSPSKKGMHASEQDVGGSCPQCLPPITENRTLMCDVCNLNHHSLCAAISDSVYDRLGKLLRDVGWVCGDCKTLARSLSVRIQSSIASLGEEMASLQTQVSNLGDRVDVACNHHCS